ncbi:hypothetical protein [Ottowia thiooxydans]|uniref:hypothetical protein n=1 Tax=Ottowia thiooxydans TaxID=219182 RepID=UPI0003FD1049|nr:hypothetical protein [Ottowia thiooxydans]
MFDICFRVIPRLLFWSRLTPILVLLVAGAFMLVRYFDPEPSQANVEQAFNGFKWNSASTPVAAVHGARDVNKEGCVPVTGAETAGYLCTVSYTTPNRSTAGSVKVTKVHLLFPVTDGKWGQQAWNQATKLEAIKLHERQSGHQFWRLLGYTAASVLLAFMLASALPRLAWDAPGMHERATPWVSAPISSGNRHVDDLSGGIATGANALTPAAAMGLFALALGATGFVLGGLVVPESFINLRYVGWAERLCLLVAAISWGVVGMRMPALCLQFMALGVVLAVLYAVLVLPSLWVFTGESPAQVYVKHVIAVDKFITPDKSRTAQAPRQGYEGYRQLMNW